MAVIEKRYDAPAHLPSVEELITMRRSGSLVLFPDEISSVDGQPVAGFRDGTQQLRVGAKRIGLNVELVVPEGTKPGHYSEHAADWVLPLISVPTSVVATLIASELRTWIERRRDRGDSRVPTIRYREVVVEDERSRAVIKEIEGSADEIVDWLSERYSLDPSDDDPPPATSEPEWTWPARE